MSQIPMQVYLEPEQHQWLVAKSHERNIPVPDFLRQIIAEYMRQRRQLPSRQEFMSIVSLGESDAEDVAERHDHYLAAEIAREHLY